MDAYERVKTARMNGRPTSLDYIECIFDRFVELHGDRRYSDDRAVVAGIATLAGMSVTVTGIEKGKDTKEKIARNFGSAQPEGYRKALRQMELAEKFKRPIVCFIDTPGAFCGIEAEERGQGYAIAENLLSMINLKVPVISILIGEGGSGGALALAVADQVWMLENAVYSVISPEGCASILWKDASKTRDAAESLKLTASDLLSVGAIERVIPETSAFADICADIKRNLIETLTKNAMLPERTLLDNRYMRFRQMGECLRKTKDRVEDGPGGSDGIGGSDRGGV